MSNLAKLGPCPIPRCALEWYLALELLTVALCIWAVVDDGNVAVSLGLDHIPEARYEWSLLIGLPALFSIGSLLTYNRALQRLASLTCLLAALILCAILLTSAHLPILAGVFVLHTLGQVFVVSMLRGAKWGFSRSCITASPPDG